MAGANLIAPRAQADTINLAVWINKMKKQDYFRSWFADQRFGPEQRLWDTVVFESDNFVAVPSLGSLVPGWLLVVPKLKILSIGSLRPQMFPEFENFLTTAASKVASRFGDVAIFEHGASRPASSVGCGVDHAHVHIVPSTADLLQGAREIAPEVHWETVPSIRSLASPTFSSKPYLYVQSEISGYGHVGIAPELPSQLFRRVIAAHLGTPQLYDWKADPGIENICETVSRLSDVPELQEAAVT